MYSTEKELYVYISSPRFTLLILIAVLLPVLITDTEAASYVPSPNICTELFKYLPFPLPAIGTDKLSALQ